MHFVASACLFSSYTDQAGERNRHNKQLLPLLIVFMEGLGPLFMAIVPRVSLPLNAIHPGSKQ